MAAKLNTYSVTLPDGRVETRKTNRTYTHAIIGFMAETQTNRAEWAVLSYTTLPAAGLRKYGNCPEYFSQVQAVNL